MRMSDWSADVCSSDLNLADIGLAPTSGDPCDLVTDKGYHSRELLKGLDGDIWKTRIAEPAPPNGYLRWHGDEAAQKAVYANRSRLKSAVGRKAMRKRGEMVERRLRSEEHTSELQSLMRSS